MIPVSDNQKYVQRLQDLLTYGLLNLNKIKVCLTLLPDSGQKIDLPDIQCDVRVLNFNVNSPTMKVAKYYFEFQINRLNARWYAKIDDDTFTDVESLVKELDKKFNWNNPCYICAQIDNSVHPIEIQILNQIEQQYLTGPKKFYHEIQGCILSKTCMDLICHSVDCKNYLARRITQAQGYTDQMAGVLTNFVGVYPVDAHFMSSPRYKRPELASFWSFGGTLAHVHPVARDLQPEFFKCMDHSNDLRRKRFENKTILFYTKNITSTLVLHSSGRILGNKHPNESLWGYDGEYLVFFDKHGAVTTRFTNDEGNVLSGRFKNTDLLHRIEIVK